MAGVRDRIEGVLGDDGPDPRWAERIEEFLYDGESVLERVAVEDAQVVVTSHRVLAFTPERDGANFQQVDRPNVVGVSTSAESDGALLMRAIRWSVVGVILVLAGVFLDFDGIVGGADLSGSGAGGVGIGGVLGAVQGMLDLLRQLDDLLQLFGALAILLGVVVLGVYLLTREPTLAVRVAGDEPALHLPRPDDARATIDRLEAAIFPGDAPGVGRGSRAGSPDRGGDGDPDPLREA